MGIHDSQVCSTLVIHVVGPFLGTPALGGPRERVLFIGILKILSYQSIRLRTKFNNHILHKKSNHINGRITIYNDLLYYFKISSKIMSRGIRLVLCYKYVAVQSCALK